MLHVFNSKKTLIEITGNDVKGLKSVMDQIE